jgi:hypothetical protein
MLSGLLVHLNTLRDTSMRPDLALVENNFLTLFNLEPSLCPVSGRIYTITKCRAFGQRHCSMAWSFPSPVTTVPGYHRYHAV